MNALVQMCGGGGVGWGRDKVANFGSLKYKGERIYIEDKKI